MVRCWVTCLCAAVAVGSACTSVPAPEFVEPTPDVPPTVFVALPPLASPEPERPPDHDGQNGECPRLQVFTDAEDVCKRGILPTYSSGSCERLDAASNRVPGLGGSAELFVRRYTGSVYSHSETVYLALRVANGYVLLGSVAHAVADCQHLESAVPERIVGDATSVEVHTTRCTLDNDGSIRCNGACPDLALARPLAPLDCSALEVFDWSSLAAGRITEDWERNEEQHAISLDWLGIDGDGRTEPHVVRTIDLGVWKSNLTIVAPTPDHWVLLDSQVPLIASTREIRVGRAPGGLYVSSWSGEVRRIHRLNMATHELEPVFPGRCGPPA